MRVKIQFIANVKTNKKDIQILYTKTANLEDILAVFINI